MVGYRSQGGPSTQTAPGALRARSKGGNLFSMSLRKQPQGSSAPGILALLSIPSFRRWSYEIFLRSHQPFVSWNFSSKMTTKVRWGDEETAALIVLSMWRYSYPAIAEILTNRREHLRTFSPQIPLYSERSKTAVRNKLGKFRAQNPKLWTQENGWNQAAVIAHLQQYGIDIEHITRLLTLTEADIENLIRVRENPAGPA